MGCNRCGATTSGALCQPCSREARRSQSLDDYQERHVETEKDDEDPEVALGDWPSASEVYQSEQEVNE